MTETNTTEIETPERKRPDGWWSLSFSGSVAGLCRKIDDSVSIPPHWKEVIKAEVRSCCSGELNFADVHAHYHTHNGASNLHLTITPRKVALG